MGGIVSVRSAVRGGGREGVEFKWQQRQWQIGRRSQSRQRILASARESTLGTAESEGVALGTVSARASESGTAEAALLCAFLSTDAALLRVWLEVARASAAVKVT